MESLRLPAYAKINLGLSIKHKRDDGFHEIETFFQQIDLKDTIRFELLRQPQILFNGNHPSVPNNESNLCVKAAELLRQTEGLRHGVEIELDKTIPSGAGLGGGSSDAATVLLGLNKLWRLNLSIEQLKKIGTQLGSDVPFFITGGTAIGTGRGEIVNPLSQTPQLPILLVFPGFAISTVWAYRQVNLDLTKRKKNITFSSFKSINFNDVEFMNSLQNDFEQFIFRKRPNLAKIKVGLKESGALYAGMSGSGSTMFGVFGDKKEALHARQQFRQFKTTLAYPIEWGYEQVN